MVALTLTFLLLYAAALLGWLRPLPDEKMVAKLEPLIFVIVGYYFGRLPSQQSEKVLKDEITRQTQKADAAQHAKEQVQQTREALEEKIKGVRAALTVGTPVAALRSSAETREKADGAGRDEAMRHSISTALNVLNA
jgi:hypothetical protein